jgi:hypothetical protein
MDILVLILAEMTFIEFLILIFLLYILSKKSKKPEKKEKPAVIPIQPVVVKSSKKQFKFKKLKNFPVLLVSVILVILILGGIMSFVQPTTKAKYNYLDVNAEKSVFLTMDIFYNQNKILNIYGWEGKLQFDGKEDRITGDKIGWFKNLNINITEKKTWNNKLVNVVLNSNESIKKADYDYKFYKNKPYFKVKFSANSKDNTKLGLMAYGFVLKDYNILLSNGTRLENDNKITNTGASEARSGSNYEFKNMNYQIFNNPSTKLSIIVYSPEAQKFKDYFYWNVYLVYVNGDNGKYQPLYFIVLEDSNLTFVDGKWQVKSKYYSGDLEEYIYSSVSKMKE